MRSPPQSVCLALLAGSLAALVACSAIETEKANDELAAKLDPLMGKSRDAVFKRLGAPDSRRDLGDEEIWLYYKNYGIRNASSGRELPGHLGSGRPSESVFNSDAATGARSANEAYDRYSIYFVDGIAVRWEGRAAR